jgi:hypothetical protein
LGVETSGEDFAIQFHRYALASKAEILQKLRNVRAVARLVSLIVDCDNHPQMLELPPESVKGMYASTTFGGGVLPAVQTLSLASQERRGRN